MTNDDEQAPMLTHDELMAGTPCHGCGQPWIDDEPWDFHGTANLTDEQRERYDAEEARFRAQHGDCGEGKYSMDGSLTMHCRRCCPPPPLSPEQKAAIGKLLRQSTDERRRRET